MIRILIVSAPALLFAGGLAIASAPTLSQSDGAASPPSLSATYSASPTTPAILARPAVP